MKKYSLPLDRRGFLDYSQIDHLPISLDGSPFYRFATSRIGRAVGRIVNSGRAEIVLWCAPLLALSLAGCVFIHQSECRSEGESFERWRQEISQIASDRQNGLYQPADLLSSYVAQEIRNYECNRENGDTSNAISLEQLKAIKKELRGAQSLVDTNELNNLNWQVRYPAE